MSTGVAQGALTRIRDTVARVLPRWLSNRNALRIGYSILYIIAFCCDTVVDLMFWGSQAPFPGRGTYSALYLIAQSRSIVRGLLQSDSSFAATLLDWLQTWEDAASDEILCKEIQRFLGTSATIRVVSRNGWFTSIDSAGNITRVQDTNWNWDSISDPQRASWWSDLWIIVYPDTWAIFTDFSDPAWLAAWGDGFGGGIGHATPRAAVNGIYQITSSLKGAHCWVEAIIWSTDASLFVPGSLTNPGNPDGRWGHWSKMVNGVPTYARTHTTASGHVRYWTPDRTGG